MHTGNGQPVRTTPGKGASNEVNAEDVARTVEPNKTSGAESKRPWAVRKVDGPSWVEKIEQF